MRASLATLVLIATVGAASAQSQPSPPPGGAPARGDVGGAETGGGAASGSFGGTHTPLKALGSGVSGAGTESGLSGYVGTWKGTYRCAQGLTGLTFTVRNAGAGLEATFDFYADPSNPRVPSGSFLLRSAGGGAGPLSFEPLRWLQQPSGYVMVGVALNLVGDTLSGSVVGAPGCTSVSLSRT